MIKIENLETYGWEAAIRGMRNPMNSWDRSDSEFLSDDYVDCVGKGCRDFLKIGPNDYKLMEKLRWTGTDHRKFMRMITVTMDITAPLYWWKEFDTYKVGTVANSCSTMHKIAAKEFTLDDFSHEHLIDGDKAYSMWKTNHDLDPTISDDDPTDYEELTSELWEFAPLDILKVTVMGLNHYRDLYLRTKDKIYWWQMIQLLPSSYNQKRTVCLNYEVLANMFVGRCNHKLYEWRAFCSWMSANLPYSELITGEFK